MIRKLVLGAAAVAIGFGGQAAMAGDSLRGLGGGPNGRFVPREQLRHDHDYVVYVRHNGHWDQYGRFETWREAERVACCLEDRGPRVRVEVVEDRCRQW